MGGGGGFLSSAWNNSDFGHYQLQTQKGSNERLFILTPTYSMQIFGKPPLSSHKTTQTTDKRLKTKNDREKTYLVLVEFLSFVQSYSRYYIIIKLLKNKGYNNVND